MDLEKWTQNIVDSTASFWNKIAAFLPNLAATIVIVVVGIFLAKLLSRWSAKLLDKLGLNALCKRIGIAEAMEKAGVEKSPAEILAKFIYFFVMLIVLLTAAETLGLDRIIYPSGIDRVAVIPAGNETGISVEQFSSQGMEHLIYELKNRYPDRFIVINTPPVLASSEARVLSKFCDQSVITVAYGRASMDAIEDAVEAIGAERVTGVVYQQ